MYAYSSSFVCTNQSLPSLIPLQTLAAIPSIDSEAAQQKLEHVRTYYELLNMTSEARYLNSQSLSHDYRINIFVIPNYLIYPCLQALLTFVTEHEHLFTPSELVALTKPLRVGPNYFAYRCNLESCCCFDRYINLLKVHIPGREVPLDAQDRMKEILSHQHSKPTISSSEIIYFSCINGAQPFPWKSSSSMYINKLRSVLLLPFLWLMVGEDKKMQIKKCGYVNGVFHSPGQIQIDSIILVNK